MYSCYLFLTSSASVRSLIFLPFTVPILACNIPLILQFSSRDLSSFPFYRFPLFLCIVIKKTFLSLLAILWNSAFSWVYLFLSSLLFTSLLSSAICKSSSGNHFPFLHFFSFGTVLITAFCTMLQTFIHTSSGILSTRSNPLNIFVTSTV